MKTSTKAQLTRTNRTILTSLPIRETSLTSIRIKCTIATSLRMQVPFSTCLERVDLIIALSMDTIQAIAMATVIKAVTMTHVSLKLATRPSSPANQRSRRSQRYRRSSRQMASWSTKLRQKLIQTARSRKRLNITMRQKSKESLRTSSKLSIKMALKSVVILKQRINSSLTVHSTTKATACPAAGAAVCPVLLKMVSSKASVNLVDGEKMNGQRAISCLY